MKEMNFCLISVIVPILFSEPIYENGDFFAVASITIVCFLITSTNVGVTMVRILGYNAPKPTRVFSIMMLVSVNAIALQ